MLTLFLIACADPYDLRERSVFTVAHGETDSVHTELEESASGATQNQSSEALTQDPEEDLARSNSDNWDFEEELADFEPTSEELVLVDLINNHRRDKDLMELSYVPEAALLARMHSENMAYGDIGITHEQYGERFASLTSVLSIQAMAENVGLAYLREYSPEIEEDSQLLEEYKAEPYSLDETSVRTLQALVQNWVESTEHEHNILGDFEWTGVGVVVAPHPDNGTSFYATQIFLRPQ